MMLVDLILLAAMALMLLIALARGAASVSHHELWHQQPAATTRPLTNAT